MGKKYEWTHFNAVSKNKVRIMSCFLFLLLCKMPFIKQLKEKNVIMSQGLRTEGTKDKESS